MAKTPSEKMGALLRLGVVYDKRKMYPQAREQWEKILQMPDASDEDKVGAYNAIAASYGEQEKWDEARAAFEKILVAPFASARDKVNAHLAMGFTLLGSNAANRELARQQFLSVAEDATLDSNVRAIAYAQIGQSYRDDGKPGEARASFTKALALPGISLALSAQLYGATAETYKSQGDAGQTQRSFEKAQVYALAAAKDAKDHKDWDAAIALHEQVLSFGKVDPAIDALSRSQIGFLLLDEGKPTEAREKFEALSQKNYGDLDGARQLAVRGLQQNAQMAIARSYIDENNAAKAREVLQRLLDSKELLPRFQESAQGLLATLDGGQNKAE